MLAPVSAAVIVPARGSAARCLVAAQALQDTSSAAATGTSPVRHCAQEQCRVLEPLTGQRGVLKLCGGAWCPPDPGPAALRRGDASASSSSTVW